MPRRKAPISEEFWKGVVTAYPDVHKASEAIKLGERTVHTYMRKYGLQFGEPPLETLPEMVEPQPTVIPAPFIDIKPLPQSEGVETEGEEVHMQFISDAHSGIITPTYNSGVFKARLNILYKTMVNLCQLHRKMRPIRKLVLPIGGDMTHGEQYGRQGMVEEFEMGAEQQIFELLVPQLTNYCVNALQLYDEVEVYIIPGNHGNVMPKKMIISRRSNWDTVLGRALQLTLAEYKDRIKVTLPPVGQWYQIFECNGWRFLLIHGDQIISYQGISHYGLERKGLRWKQSIGVDEPFDYMLTAHVHNPNFLWNAGIPTFVNGCFITDSPFPLLRMGLKDVPAQWSMFVNRRYGVTARYVVDLGGNR